MTIRNVNGIKLQDIQDWYRDYGSDGKILDGHSKAVQYDEWYSTMSFRIQTEEDSGHKECEAKVMQESMEYRTPCSCITRLWGE